MLGSLTPLVPRNFQFLLPLGGGLQPAPCRGERAGGDGDMGSFVKLAKRAVETDAPVMVKVTNFSYLVEIAS